jgi:hypothetical protein
MELFTDCSKKYAEKTCKRCPVINAFRTEIYFCHQNQKIKKMITFLDAIETQ